MKKICRAIAGFMSVVLVCSAIGGEPVLADKAGTELLSAEAESAGGGSSPDAEAESAGGGYREGEAIVAMIAPGKTLMSKKEAGLFGENIRVEKTWNFGSAEIAAEMAAETGGRQSEAAGNLNKQKENAAGAASGQNADLSGKTLYVAKVSSEEYSTDEIISKLEDEPYVCSVEPNYYQKKMEVGDPLADYQWYLDGKGVEGEGIHYSELEQEAVSDDNAPVVAVVDTGIDYTHEDLSDKMWKNGVSGLPGECGYDFGDDDDDPMDQDIDGHGTHVAGVIGAAVDNGTGIAGLSLNAKLMALKVMDKNEEMDDAYIIDAFDYIYQAQQAGVNVAAVNCSWGGGTTGDVMPLLIDKIGEKGAVFLFAAGNDNREHGAGDWAPECPYDINSPYVVIIGSSNVRDRKSGFSDYGKQTVDFFAPGDRVLSTVWYDVFYPAIYPVEQREKMCSYFCSYDEDGGNAGADLYWSGGTGNEKIKYSACDAFGKAGSGSVVLYASDGGGENQGWNADARWKSRKLQLYADVTSLGIDPDARYYISAEFGSGDEDDLLWEHNSAEVSSGDFVSMNGHTYVFLHEFTDVWDDFKVYIDDVSISVADLPEEFLCKYDKLTGTSMATPFATAAVAVLASMNSGDNVLQRIARLKKCVRREESLADFCIQGGILDFSKIIEALESKLDDSGSGGTTVPGAIETALPSGAPAGTEPSGTETAAPTGAPAGAEPSGTETAAPSGAPAGNSKIKVKKITLNKKSAVLRYKKVLKLKAVAKPSNAANKKVKWSVSAKNKKYVSVTQKGAVSAKKKGIGHKVRVFAKAADGSGAQAHCDVKIKL